MNLGDINNSDIQRFAKTLQQFMEVHQIQMQEIAKPLTEFTKTQVFKDLENKLFKSQQAINAIATVNQEFGERMSLIGKRLAVTYDVSDQLRSLLEKLSTNIKLEIDESVLNEIRANQIVWQDSLINELESRVEQLERGHSSRQGLQITLNNLLQLIIILLMLAQMSDKSVEESLNKIHSEQQMTNQILQEFEGFSERFETFIDKVETDDNKLLLVNREASIHIKPNPKSERKVTVFQGQHLDLINSIKRWYQVKYFDFETSRVDTGWIYKGNVELRGLENGD